MSFDLGLSHIWLCFQSIFLHLHWSIRIYMEKEMLDYVWYLKRLCFIVYLVEGRKSLPLAASLLFCTTCGSQSKHAVCTYHIWHVLSLERPDWSVRKCCGLVFWATDSFLFPRPPNTPSSHSLACSYTQHKQTHAFCPSWFLFLYWGEYFLLFCSTSIGTGYPRLFLL